MRIFITGASGFVGGHVVETLAERHELLAMSRSDRSAELAREFGAAAVPCSLEDVEAEHLRDAEVVVHAAAHVADWGSREQFWRANVEGTGRLLDAARQAGVRRFIHIGTEAGLFAGQDLVDIDEDQPEPPRHRFHYCETKAAAERLVLAADAPEFTALCLRPRLIWGPRDATILPGLLELVDAGRFMWIDQGRARTSSTHVANLVHGVELALERGQGGQAYFIVDDGHMELREFMTSLAATAGVDLGERAGGNIGRGLARALASVVEAGYRVVPRSKPPMTRHAIAMMSATTTIKSDKAQRELGYEPVISVARGMSELSAR